MEGWGVEMAAGHHNRATDVEMLARLAPISGWEDQPLVSLPKATKNLPVKNITIHAQVALEVGEDHKFDHPDDPRTEDQLGAVHLYSQGWAITKDSLYDVLNSTLSDKDRAKLTVWFLFIKLLMTALVYEPMLLAVRIAVLAVRITVALHFIRHDSCLSHGSFCLFM